MKVGFSGVRPPNSKLLQLQRVWVYFGIWINSIFNSKTNSKSGVSKTLHNLNFHHNSKMHGLHSPLLLNISLQQAYPSPPLPPYLASVS